LASPSLERKWWAAGSGSRKWFFLDDDSGDALRFPFNQLPGFHSRLFVLRSDLVDNFDFKVHYPLKEDPPFDPKGFPVNMTYDAYGPPKPKEEVPQADEPIIKLFEEPKE
jgi:hypothetical protein